MLKKELATLPSKAPPSRRIGGLYSSYEHSYWLDKRTGKVVLIDDEVACVLREGEDLSDLPDWQRKMAEEMRPVLRALGELPGGDDEGAVESERLVEIPKDESHDA